MQVQRDLIIQVIAGLAIDWKEPPGVHGTAVSGSAVVTNQTANDFDLTVVIVAVNKIGRATALGVSALHAGRPHHQSGHSFWIESGSGNVLCSR